MKQELIRKKATRLIKETINAENEWSVIDSRVWSEASLELEWRAEELFKKYNDKAIELCEYLLVYYNYTQKEAIHVSLMNPGSLLEVV